MRLVKILIASMILLCAVFLLIVVSVQYFIDPNRLKPFIVSQVKQQTGYDFTLDGRLGWSLYPFFSLTADGMSMARPHEPPFLALKRVKLGTSIGKLLFNRTEDLSGFIDIDQARLMMLHATQVSLRFLLFQHNLTIDPIFAHFYGGSVHAALAITDINKMPKWQGSITAGRVQLQALLADVGMINKLNIAGLARAHFVGDTVGKTNTQMTQALNGHLNFGVENGVLYGIDMNYLIQSARAILRRETLPQAPEKPQTAFSQIEGEAAIHQGIATLNNTTLVASALKATITGNIDLLKQNVDLRLMVQSTDPDLKDWSIPAIVRGNLQHLTVELDREAVQKMLINAGVNRLQQRLNDRLDNRIPEEAKGLLDFLNH